MFLDGGFLRSPVATAFAAPPAFGSAMGPTAGASNPILWSQMFHALIVAYTSNTTQNYIGYIVLWPMG